MPTVSEAVDRDMIAGKVQRLVEQFRERLITEYVLQVSLQHVLRDADEVRATMARAKLKQERGTT